MTDAGYFAAITGALRDAGSFQPCLVLDLDRLDRNIAAVRAHLPDGLALRIVDKSLPCLPLIDRIRKAFDTYLVMSFHPQITIEVLSAWPKMQALYGKPMPVQLARQVLTEHPGIATRIIWLIDTPERLAQYNAVAEELGADLSFCFEVDIGLHRGGLPDPDALGAALASLTACPKLHCQGVMAYEAHIGHIPALLGGPAKAQRKSIELFRNFVGRLGPRQRKIINLGGSSTALTYESDVGANEVSIGSAFVKPTDFDVPSLSNLEAAIFIAAPVLKTVDVQLPGLDARSWVAQLLRQLPRRGCYTYGGKWMAKPVFPAGAKDNSLIGHSTNQQFFGLPDDCALGVDDCLFLRPTQSEFVLQQLGPLKVYSGGRIVDHWNVLAPG